MRPTRRLGSSHGILHYAGVMDRLAELMGRLTPAEGTLLGYPEGWDTKAASVLREMARVCMAEAHKLESGVISDMESSPKGE